MKRYNIIKLTTAGEEVIFAGVSSADVYEVLDGLEWADPKGKYIIRENR